MSWLKSPWFWLLALLAVALAWLLFFRGSSRPLGGGAPKSTSPTGVSFFGRILDSVEARFSVGDSIMGGTGSG